MHFCTSEHKPVYVCVCFNKHRKLMEVVSLWAQRADLWRSDGSKQSRRHSTILSVTRNPIHLQRTESQWMIWLRDHTTRSQCGLLALMSLSVTISPALHLPVCFNVSYFKSFICLFDVWPSFDTTVLFYATVKADKMQKSSMVKILLMLR